jgi:tetratricopeptide (TPR) repeat protein
VAIEREPEWLAPAREALDCGSFELAIERLAPHIARVDAPAAALHVAGQSLARVGRLTEATALLRRALAREDSAAARADLGNVLQLLGDHSAAEAEYRRSLAIDRAQPSAWYNLARALERRGAVAEAAACLDEALALEPGFAEALKAYVPLAGKLPRLWEAVERWSAHALEVAPGLAAAHEVIGFVRLKRDLDARRATEAFELAIRAGGGGANLYGNLGIAFQDLGRIPDALAAYERALALDPHNPLVRWHRSLALLLAGRLEEAWPDYELRLRSEDAPRRSFPIPRWDGRTVPEGQLLISAEQGLGDEIMFASCVPEVLALGARCVIECHTKLEAIFRRSFPQAAAVRAGTQLEDLRWLADFPDIGCYVPAGSLPLEFRRSVTDFPRHHGYLKADPVKVSAWKARLDALGSLPKVGFSWRGGTEKTRRRLRTPGVEDLAALLREPGVEWVSLQYDASETEVRDLAAMAGARLHHFAEAIADYDETAALLCALELTVSVCTAVIHLGGALGRPVWVMAPFSPEWRYGLYWERMPWYPTVRVLRQSAPGSWTELIGRVKNELAAWRRTL